MNPINFIYNAGVSFSNIVQQNPYAAAATAAVVGCLALPALYRCWSSSKIASSKQISPLNDSVNYPDLPRILQIAQEIKDLKPTICDSADYRFLASHGSYIDQAKAKKGALSMLAAAAFARSQGKTYNECPEAILQLGNAFLESRSGQCDHAGAAVIAKIVQHIKNGGEWSSSVELVGSGGHAFVIINRKKGDFSNPIHWGKGTITVDSWLGCCEVHPDYRESIPVGTNGVLYLCKDVVRHAKDFGAQSQRLRCSHKFTVEELYHLAGR